MPRPTAKTRVRPAKKPRGVLRKPQAQANERDAKALQDIEAKLKAVLETAVDAIVTINERGIMQSVNPATERIFGYAAAEMIGRNVSMLMPSPYEEEHDGYLARYLRTGEKRIIGIGREVQGKRCDGAVFPIDLAVSEVERGKLFTGIIRDISDRKLAEARARENDRMVSIGTLAAGLGHDMNNVLLPVRAHLNALKVELGANDSKHHVERIQRGVDYLQQLADGLHFLAMDPETVDDEAGTTNLAQWWTQTGALLSKAVPKHVKVKTDLSEDLPGVAVAAHALTQAMLNLIVNAGEAIPANGDGQQGCVRVWATVSNGGALVRLGVTDNGTGMRDDVKRRAFELFFTTKPRGLGTGLGLALVRKVADRAGGHVEIESAPGRGTTVTMHLPAVDASVAEVQDVVVSLADRRAASFVANLAEAAGAKVHVQDAPNGARIWITEPTPDQLSAAKEWRISRPEATLVLFGEPVGRNRQSWLALGPIVIERSNDLWAIRAALGEALAQR